MRILIAGLGSVGRRHLRNLQALGERDLVLYRTHHSTLPEEELAGFPVETNLETALARKPDAVVVANPTALHLDVAIPAAQAGCHVLIEKPVSHNRERVEELRQAQARAGSRILVGFQFRFHPLLRKLRAVAAEGGIGRPRWAQARYAEYLPGWHPWEDYRAGYSARADLGGGALLTLCHPFDYLPWILGPLTCEAARVQTIGDLEVDVDDYVDAWLSGPSDMRASVHLDYYEQPPAQWLTLAGEAGMLHCDFLTHRLEGWTKGAAGELAESAPPGWERNDMFREEMAHFLRVCRGEEEPACGLEEGVRTVSLIEAVKAASLQWVDPEAASNTPTGPRTDPAGDRSAQ